MSMWGGRFSGGMDETMREFSASFAFDRRLYGADIRGSIAYARALERVGIIGGDELQAIMAGLRQVQDEFASSAFQPALSDEDIHTAVERRLAEILGPVAGKLHTGRSRNDQVATDLRLYLLDTAPVMHEQLVGLQRAIIEKASAHLDLIMPGYTHTRPAQPLRFSHWLMSFFWRLQRDRGRLEDATRRTSVLPLGAGAVAGNPFGIDRQALADDLGFAALSENSVDAVSDRDYVVEWLTWGALVQVHLSNLAEDLILYGSPQYGFVALDDAYCTGSSLMPQKKNADALELMRGKGGRLAGHLLGLLTTLKGLPSGYNRDLQEDKEVLFDAIDTLACELPIAAGIVRTMEPHAQRMRAALDDSLLATDVADYLVRKGVPFRQSHYLVGQLVKTAEKRGCSLGELPMGEYRAVHEAFDADVYAVFDHEHSVERRDVLGGTSRRALEAQIRSARSILNTERAAVHGVTNL